MKSSDTGFYSSGTIDRRALLPELVSYRKSSAPTITEVLSILDPNGVVKNYRELLLVVDQRKAWEKDKISRLGMEVGLREGYLRCRLVYEALLWFFGALYIYAKSPFFELERLYTPV